MVARYGSLFFCLASVAGVHSVHLANAASAAPVRSHRSAAASLSPPNAYSSPEQGTFHNQRR